MSTYTIVPCARCGAIRHKYNNITYKTDLCTNCTRSLRGSQWRARTATDMARSRVLGAKSIHAVQAASLNSRRKTIPITLATVSLENKP